MRRDVGVFALATVAATIAATLVTTQEAAHGTVLGASRPDTVPGSYIVVLKDSKPSAASVADRAHALAAKYRGTVGFVYRTVLRGFSVKLGPSAASRLAADPAVAFVEPDRIFTAAGTQSPTPSWGLDRVDQRNLPLDNSYTYPSAASEVHAYILDTGIRITHNDFGGRASDGHDSVGGHIPGDCDGHGTHVAGTVGGTSYGVAKGVQLVSVRVLDCEGSGTSEHLIEGVEWVTNNAIHPAVANMSLSGPGDLALDTAVAESIDKGITYSVAAGNTGTSGIDPCKPGIDGRSPARVPTAITVGSTTDTDARSSFSNWGTCLDLFAPGSSIVSDWNGSNMDTATLSGTSMSTAHVTGAAALVLSAHPTWTTNQVSGKVVGQATAGVVTDPHSSPNRLLYVDSNVFLDTFESSQGWTTNPNGTDTATMGQWERGDPEDSFLAVPLQLATTVSGTNDLVTGAAAGCCAGVYDVDDGVTSIQSPLIELPGSGTLTLSFSWYLGHLSATNKDYVRVSVVVGGAATVVLNQAGSPPDRAAAWATAVINISSYAGQSIRIRVEAADENSASIIEAGVDDVKIVQS